MDVDISVPYCYWVSYYYFLCEMFLTIPLIFIPPPLPETGHILLIVRGGVRRFQLYHGMKNILGTFPIFLLILFLFFIQCFSDLSFLVMDRFGSVRFHFPLKLVFFI